MVRFLFRFYKYEVISIHATWEFHLIVGPFVCFISKLFRKKVIYHFFGGKWHKKYDEYPVLLKRILNGTILKSDYKLMETKMMIAYFQKENIRNLIWFPNARKPHPEITNTVNFKKKCVFISRVTPTKGVNTILEVSNKLPEGYEIDIYGPLNKYYYNKKSFEDYRVSYKGVLQEAQVMETLKKYDLLLLPTYHPGEGYPGIIIEALSVGRPVITTRWNALGELVTSDFNGKLIPTKSVNGLKNAIEFFNTENYKDYSKNALTSFEQFNIFNISNKLIDLYYD